MTKFSSLSGVAHNIAHHSASGISYLLPHMAHALRESGVETAQVELLTSEPYPTHVIELKPLRLALSTLKSTIMDMLLKHGFTKDDVTSVVLYATPAPWDKDGSLLHTRTVITARNGRMYDSGWLKQ